MKLTILFKACVLSTFLMSTGILQAAKPNFAPAVILKLPGTGGDCESDTGYSMGMENRKRIPLPLDGSNKRYDIRVMGVIKGRD